jgi:hypothetical protein
MTRAVLLPAGADPFLIAYWLRHYRSWAAYVDELHVAICGPIPSEVRDYIEACADAVGVTTFSHFAKRTPHGQVMASLLGSTSADHVMFVEEDAFIRKPEVVRDSFAALENGDTDLIGCPRDGYASESIVNAARRRFGDGLRGLAFWPTFVFASRAHLEATDKRFEAIVWDPGDAILGTTLIERATSDTFVWGSYQLRDQGLRVTLREPYHVGEDVSSDAPWFHVGSLSSGHGYLWQSGKPMPAEQYAAEVEHWKRLPAGETAKRVAWWQRAWEHWDGGIPDYHEEYGAGLQKFMADFGVTQGDVDGYKVSYDYLPTWAQL